MEHFASARMHEQCLHTYVYAHMYACMYTYNLRVEFILWVSCIYIYIYVIYIYTHTHIYIYMACICIHMYVCMHAYKA
jgi:hypothetical protein